MKQRAAGDKALTNLAIDLSSITRGSRTLSGFRESSQHLWIDRWHGRAALRFARVCGKRVSAAWPGPVWSRGPAGTPLLSWFCLPVADASADAFAAALNSALTAAFEHDRNIRISSEVEVEVKRLMQRFAQSQASTLRQSQTVCPAALLETRRTTRVLLIDERTRPTGLSAIATRNSQHAARLHANAASRAQGPSASRILDRAIE
jgi:capsular polysaccharide export protein